MGESRDKHICQKEEKRICEADGGDSSLCLHHSFPFTGDWGSSPLPCHVRLPHNNNVIHDFRLLLVGWMAAIFFDKDCQFVVHSFAVGPTMRFDASKWLFLAKLKRLILTVVSYVTGVHKYTIRIENRSVSIRSNFIWTISIRLIFFFFFVHWFGYCLYFQKIDRICSIMILGLG